MVGLQHLQQLGAVLERVGGAAERRADQLAKAVGDLDQIRRRRLRANRRPGCPVPSAQRPGSSTCRARPTQPASCRTDNRRELGHRRCPPSPPFSPFRNMSQPPGKSMGAGCNSPSLEAMATPDCKRTSGRNGAASSRSRDVRSSGHFRQHGSAFQPPHGPGRSARPQRLRRAP